MQGELAAPLAFLDIGEGAVGVVVGLDPAPEPGQHQRVELFRVPDHAGFDLVTDLFADRVGQSLDGLDDDPRLAFPDRPGRLRGRDLRIGRVQALPGHRVPRAGRLGGPDPSGRLARVQTQQQPQELSRGPNRLGGRYPAGLDLQDLGVIHRGQPAAQLLGLAQDLEQRVFR